MTAARPVRRSPYLATPSHTLTLRLKLARRPGTLARVLGVVARARAAVGAMDLVQGGDAHNVRDLTVQVASEEGGGACWRRWGASAAWRSSTRPTRPS